MATSRAVFNWLGYSGEDTSFSLEMDYPADGDEWEAREAQIDALAVALKAASLCNLNSYGYAQLQSDEAGTPSSPYAQREIGMRVFWREVSGDPPRKGTFTIPGPDLSILAQPNTDEVDLTVSVAAAIKTALETVWNAALDVDREIYRMRIVGRAS